MSSTSWQIHLYFSLCDILFVSLMSELSTSQKVHSKQHRLVAVFFWMMWNDQKLFPVGLRSLLAKDLTQPLEDEDRVVVAQNS